MARKRKARNHEIVPLNFYAFFLNLFVSVYFTYTVLVAAMLGRVSFFLPPLRVDALKKFSC